MEAIEAAARWRRLRALIPEKRAARQRHTVAVTALAKDAFDPLGRRDQAINLVQLAIDQPTPVVLCATPPGGGQQPTYVGQAHPEAATKSNHQETIDRVRVIAALAAHPIRLWQDADIFVIANGGGAKAAGGRNIPDAQRRAHESPIPSDFVFILDFKST